MRSSGIKIGRLFSIDIFIDYSWFVILIISVWIFWDQYFPRIYEDQSSSTYFSLAIISSLVLFLSVLIHELAHSLVAKQNRMPVKRISLYFFGGASELFFEPKSPEKEFQISIVGPATNIILAIIFGLLWSFFDRYFPNLYLISLLSTLFQINFILSIFNLLPGFPLDGGRLVRSIAWAITKNFSKATNVASTIGQGLAILIAIFGVFQIIISGFWGGIWLILIGVFLHQTAKQASLELRIKNCLKNLSIEKLSNKNIIFLPPQATINDTLEEYFLKYYSQSFPVVEKEKVVGTISFSDIRKNYDKISEESRVIDIMRKYPNDLRAEPNQSCLSALKKMLASEVAFLPVTKNHKIVSFITLDNIAGHLNKKGLI